MIDTVKVEILTAGSDLQLSSGYGLLRGDKVAAFFIDHCNIDVQVSGYCENSIYLYDAGKKGSKDTLVSFPEFKGWDVHSCFGGSNIAICLIKSN